MRPIALLALWQVRNALRTTLTDPRKLIPLVVLVFAVGLQLLPVLLGAPPAAPPPLLSDLLAQHLHAIHAILFTAFVLIALALLEQGFSGGAIAFTMADVDYLFPAPIPRHVVLAWRLPSIIGSNLLKAGLFLWLGYFFLWRMLAPGVAYGRHAWVLFFSLAFWMAGYANIAVAAEVAFGRGRAALAKRVSFGLLVAVAVWVAFLVWRGGLDGFAAVERNPVLLVLFYPCHLLTQALFGPVTGRVALAAPPWLFLFFGATLALALTRRGHFYEASLPHSERVARIRQAAKEGNIGLIWQQRFAERTRRPKEQRHPYAIPPFGRGGAAVLWANLAAAAKRPFVRFYGPFLGGVALVVVARLWAERAAPTIALGAIAYVAYLTTILSCRIAFRQALARYALTRALPVPPWQVILAEVLPVILTPSLAGWGAALPLSFAPGRFAHLVAASFFILAPALLVCLSLIQFIVTLWYPLAQDKLQQLFSGFVGMLLTGVLALGLTPFVLVPALLHAPDWLLVGLAFLGCLAAGTALLLFAASVYRRAEPDAG